MELFVEYFVVLINGLLFMTTKATRIDLIGLVCTSVYIFRKYIVFELRYDPRYRVNSQSKSFKVRPCLSSSFVGPRSVWWRIFQRRSTVAVNLHIHIYTLFIDAKRIDGIFDAS